jgi:hypothetical protein
MNHIWVIEWHREGEWQPDAGWPRYYRSRDLARRALTPGGRVSKYFRSERIRKPSKRLSSLPRGLTPSELQAGEQVMADHHNGL